MSLPEIAAKVQEGARLSEDDAAFLLQYPDLLAVGELAALANRRLHGDKVYFNVNRHINYTNLCVNKCAFCAFRRDEGAAGGYTLTLDEIAARAGGAGCGRCHRSARGGWPAPPFAAGVYTNNCSAPSARQARCCISRVSPPWSWNILPVSAGYRWRRSSVVYRRPVLQSLPGGGAEIFAERARAQLCPEKISGSRWLEVMRVVHAAGLRSNATMLFGHIETQAERIDHLARLRALQDETGGFQAFVALPFQHVATRLDGLRGPGGVDILKTLAVARLFLDNISHIKAYWVMLGVKLAQVALAFGVNDLDGTVVEEQIGHQAGAASPQALSREGLMSLIRKADRTPVERDSLYRELCREGGGC